MPELNTNRVAVVCLLSDQWAQGINLKVHQFQSTEDAFLWMKAMLEAGGQIETDGVWWYYEGQSFANSRDAILAFQFDLPMNQVFHVLPMVNYVAGGVRHD